MEDFIIRALLAAAGIATITGSLGCFVIWKRMSYFSESISHSALLGISLGLASGVGIHIGLLTVGIVLAILIVIMQQRNILSSDAILGIFSHISLSLGIIILTFMGNFNTDYFSLLFGDILSITNQDIILIYTILIFIGIVFSIFWQRLILLTLNEELGVASGLNRLAYQLLFMLTIVFTVSISVQIIGVLLITSLLIIPPATAKVFSTNPAQMLLLSIIISIIAIILGMLGSTIYDTATGPTIVVVLGVLFALSQIVPSKT